MPRKLAKHPGNCAIIFDTKRFHLDLSRGAIKIKYSFIEYAPLALYVNRVKNLL